MMSTKLYTILLTFVLFHNGCKANFMGDIAHFAKTIGGLGQAAGNGIVDELEKPLIHAVLSLDYNKLILSQLKKVDVSKLITDYINKIDVQQLVRNIGTVNSFNVTEMLILYINHLDAETLESAMRLLALPINDFIKDEEEVNKLFDEIDLNKWINSYLKQIDTYKIMKLLSVPLSKIEFTLLIPKYLSEYSSYFWTILRSMGGQDAMGGQDDFWTILRSMGGQDDVRSLLKALIHSPEFHKFLKENINLNELIKIFITKG